MKTPLEHALEYSRIGFSVMPLRDGKGDDLKKPSYKWEQYQEVAADEELINLWWEENPNRGVAIITGTVSRLVVLDFDGPKAAALMEAKGYPLTPTATVQTGKGMHLYYKTSEKIGNKVALFTDGMGSQVDVRGEGGYVVAPPSKHGSGRQYLWTRPLSEIVVLPPLLEDLLLSGEPTDSKTLSPDSDWYTTVELGVGEGLRNDACAKMAGYALRVCAGNRDAAERFTLLWNRQNTPPLPEQEVKSVVTSVYKKHTTTQKAEAQKLLPKQKVITGSEWARDLENAGPRKGEGTGMPGLHLVDGLVPGDLITLAGRPGMGKSTFATQLCVYAALQRLIPTWIVSTEMNRTQWGRWMACVALDSEYANLPKPLPKNVLDQFRAAPITITDAGSITIAELAALAKGHQGIRLIIVDHIGRVGANRRENRTLEVGEVVRGLKGIARDQECTVIALCQLNREIEHRENRRPRLSDLRESGEVEQESDAVFFLYSQQEIKKQEAIRPITLALEKFRHGPVRDLRLEFELGKRRFVEVER